MKQQINIDASSLSQSACILNWYRTIVGGYRGKTSGASLIYGTAFHKFIDTMFKTKGDIGAAKTAACLLFNRPKVTGKNQSHLADENHFLCSCLYYWNDHILKDNQFDVLLLPNDKPATEVTFSFPYYEDDHIVVRLTGTIDRIGKIKNGVYCLRDFKTTSTWDVKNYLADYKMSKQLRFYVLALKLMAKLEPESVLGQIGATRIGTFIDGIFLKARPTDNIYASSEMFMFPDADIAEFQTILDKRIRDLSFAVAANVFLREGIVNDTCNAGFGCKFTTVCAAPTEVQQILLDRDYNKVVYDPLKFGETL